MINAREVTARLADLLHRERVAMADFLVALADFDRRRLWLDLGHASLFYFLHRELGLSKGAAFYRKTAAQLIQKFPEVVAPLRDGRLCLTSIVELSKVMTPDNRDDVLPRFFQLSKREAKAVSAALQPDEAAPRREVVTTVRVPVAAAGPDPTGTAERHPGRVDAPSACPPCGGSTLSPPGPMRTDRADPAVHPDEPRGDVSGVERVGREPARAGARPSEAEPLTAELSRLHVTVSRRFLEKLEAARAALSHARPGATADEILEAGLDLLLAQQAKRRGIVEKPRQASPPSRADHVPAHVSRAVWTRDGGRCQWQLDRGGICGSTHQVEIDHVVPRARGGPSTVENTRLLCRAHNQLAARCAYGDEWMDRFTRGRLKSPPGDAPVTAASP